MSSSFKPSSIGYFLLLDQYTFRSIFLDQSAKFLSPVFPNTSSITSLSQSDSVIDYMNKQYDLFAFFGDDASSLLSLFSKNASNSHVLALIKLSSHDIVIYILEQIFRRFNIRIFSSPRSSPFDLIHQLYPGHSLSIYTPIPSSFEPEMIIDDSRYPFFYRRCCSLKSSVFPYFNFYNCLFHACSRFLGVSIYPYKLVVLRPL